MSDLLKKLKLAAESGKIIASNIINNKELSVSDEIYEKRMSICHGCPKFNKELKKCNECGCFLTVKARLSGMKCPLNHWEDIK